MPSAEAQVQTDRPSRYLVQLCRHASQMGRHRITRLPAHMAGDPQMRHQMPQHVDAEWSDTQGTINVDGGTCTIQATSDALILRAEATDEENLQRMQDLIARNLTQFSRRDPLTVSWYRLYDPGESPGQTGGAASTPEGQHPARRGRRRIIVLTVVGVLAVAAHVVLGIGVLAAPPWAGLAASAVLVIVLVKAALIGLGYFAHRHRKASRSRVH